MKISAGRGSRPSSAWASAMPFMPAIWMSSSPRSGSKASISRSAAAPSAAVPTRLTSGIRAHNICRRSIASGSSSTINVLRSLGIELQRDLKLDAESTTVSRSIGAFRRAVEGRGEALAHITQADPIPGTGPDGPIGVVFNGQMQRVAALARTDRDDDRFAGARDAVFDDIFDQRLENQTRHPRFLQSVRHVHRHRQAPRKPDLFDLEI